MSYPWIAVPCLDPARGAYKRMCRVLRKASSLEGYKSSNISSAVFRPVEEEREKRRFRKRLREGRGWRRANAVGEGGDATMTTPPDAHQYPRVGCHIFLPIQMTPPRGPIPAS